MPARKDIDPALVEHWATLYLGTHYDFEADPDLECWSLSEIAREYGVSRGLVKDRLEGAFPGITGDAHGDDQPGDGSPNDETSAARTASDGAAARPNGHRRDPYVPLPELYQD